MAAEQLTETMRDTYNKVIAYKKVHPDAKLEEAVKETGVSVGTWYRAARIVKKLGEGRVAKKTKRKAERTPQKVSGAETASDAVTGETVRISRVPIAGSEGEQIIIAIGMGTPKRMARFASEFIKRRLQ